MAITIAITDETNDNMEDLTKDQNNDQAWQTPYIALIDTIRDSITRKAPEYRCSVYKDRLRVGGHIFWFKGTELYWFGKKLILDLKDPSMSPSIIADKIISRIARVDLKTHHYQSLSENSIDGEF